MNTSEYAPIKLAALFVLFIAGLAGMLISGVDGSPAAASEPQTTSTPTPGGCSGSSSWRIVSSPNGAQYSNTLFDVAALSSNDVWAVGESGPLPTETVILHWDGTRWTAMPDPITGTLRGVTAIAPNDVWAVGFTTGGPSKPLTMHWDGTTWSVVPNPGGQFLYDVIAVASDDVWAVGKHGYYGVAMHWDGTEWSEVPTPQVRDTNLVSLAVLSSNDIWAVGGVSQRFTYTVHWDGTEWTHVPSPNPGSSRNFLQGVTAIAPNDVWAAGWYQASYLDEEWMAMHWDGTSWRFVPVQLSGESSPRSQGKLLYGIAGVSTTEVWAVGQEYDDWYARRNTVVLKWDGAAWRRTPSASSSNINLLYGIDMLAPGTGWIVGSSGVDEFQPNTMIQAFGPPCVTSTPVPPTATPGGPTNTPAPPTPTACAPGSEQVFTGAITSNDPTQNGRLADDEPSSNCVLITSCYDMQATPRYYDSYTLTNHSAASVCVTIDLHAPNCGGFNFVQSAAYLNSFDPQVVCANYLGDIGEGPYPRKEYTVIVPGNASIVVVINAIEEGFGCSGYTLRVRGLPNPGCATPTSTPIRTSTVRPTNTSTRTPGTPTVTRTRTATRTPLATSTALASATPDASATATGTPCPGSTQVTGSITGTDPQQDGRLFRDNAPDSCDIPGTCGTPIAGSYHYDLHTFVNGSESAQCVTVSITTACSGTNFISSGAYLGAFEPGAVCTNFLASTATSPNPTSSYSFTVPAGETFVVNVHEVTEGAGCASYSLTISGCMAPPGPAPCAIGFSDVPVDSTFYPYVSCLACRGILSGYADGTFRPNAALTRGQLAKIVANAAGYNEPVSSRTFEDVLTTDAFYPYIERLVLHGAMGGYACGGPGEPCGSTNMPYFRPGSSATRGQISKIVAMAAGMLGGTGLSVQMFEDVVPGTSFYDYIQSLASREVVSGYACGGPGEPCGSTNMPYFRPGANITRGQISKVVTRSFIPACEAAGR